MVNFYFNQHQSKANTQTQKILNYRHEIKSLKSSKEKPLKSIIFKHTEKERGGGEGGRRRSS